jgi:hypothetical protein
METKLWLAAVVVAFAALAGMSRGARKRRKSSIRGMLDGTRPCAVRTRA